MNCGKIARPPRHLGFVAGKEDSLLRLTRQWENPGGDWTGNPRLPGRAPALFATRQPRCWSILCLSGQFSPAASSQFAAAIQHRISQNTARA
jgi:hypothetical protein